MKLQLHPPSDYYVHRSDVRRDYNQATREELIRDVNTCHDFTRKLVHDKDVLAHHLRNARWYIRGLAAVVTAEFAVIGLLAKLVFSHWH